jgi:GTP-binding protein
MLARPWVNAFDTASLKASWMANATVDDSTRLFSRPVVHHKVTGLFNVDTQVLTRVPAVAIVGESNVGKSTLLNNLMRLRAPRDKVKLNSHLIEYSPVSATPGRTRHVFRFDLGNRLSICDLPGYGAAHAPKDIQDTWNELIEKFLNTANIRRALVLIDGTTGIKELDDAVMTMLQDKGIPVQLVITKVDLLSRTRLHETVSEAVAHILRKPRDRVFPFIHAVSAERDLGMTELRHCLAAIAQDLER